MGPDLILKDILDPHVRENFFRLKNFLASQVFFDGDFKLFDLTIDRKETSLKVEHGLTFIPSDIIVLSVVGNYNFFFRYSEFTKEAMYITTDGPVRVRFLAGKLKDRGLGRAASSMFDLVAPGDILLPSPGFVFAAVNDKMTGFWLTNESIPSNVVGLPVLFGNSRIIQAAVGTELEANYQIGIFQHQGQSVGLTQIGDFSITSGGDKRVSLDIDIDYTQPNVQLATRILSGTTRNLKVSLVLKGSLL